MIFRLIRRQDLAYIFQWLEQNDYLRSGVLERYVNEGRAYTVEIDGKPVAVGIIHVVGGEGAWLMGARVMKEHRGHGVGKHLTQGLVEEASRSGFKWAALLTSVDNKPVHRICEKLGFQIRAIISWMYIDKDKIYRLGEGGVYISMPSTDRKALDHLKRSIGNNSIVIPDSDNMWVWRPPSEEAIERMILASERLCLARDGGFGVVALISSRRDRGTIQTLVLETQKTMDSVSDIAGCIAYESMQDRFGEIELIVVERPGHGWSVWESIYQLAREKPWRAYVFYKEL
ncbi:MAG TPA: GNAT family N-acetyltransferase [Sulfolobales archaeon]|nr:GNAT family N-acetyltransferase [Sulfolobales archaeon]